MANWGVGLHKLRWQARAALLSMVAAICLASSISVGSFAQALPPPVSQATAESDLMIYSAEGSSKALKSASTTASFGATGYPIDNFTGPMPFNVGYVQHRPHVYAIFWGSEWNGKAAAREKILDLYRWLPGSSYANILTQYFDYGGPVSNQTDLSSFTDTRVVKPPISSSSDIRAEVDYAIANQPGWQGVNYENQYVVFTPPGTPVAPGACGYHGWSGQYSFTYVPWSPPECRRGLEPPSSMQVTASHEWAESTVDPIPLIDYWGWTITEIQGEIADLCNTGTAAEHAEAAPGIFAAKLTDDYLWAANGTPCVVQDAAPIKFQVGTGGTNVQPRRAVLNGNVTPAGWPAYYQFAITGPEGTTYIPPRNGSPAAHYGFASVGQGFGNEPVSVTAPNLKPNTTYTVRLDALGALTEPKVISEYGHLKIFSGSEVQFTTPSWRPIVSGESVSGRAMEGATVNASINPQESPTHYAFEYGPTPAYGNRQPVPDENIGAGGSPVAVSQVLSGLSPEDSYHYHVVAANAEGTTTGSDRAFTTLGRPFTFLSAFGTAGTGNGQFNRPMGTAVDASGNVYVVDRENNRVQKFNAKGEYLSQFGSAGSGNGQFKEPRSIAIGPNGHLWVADAGNARIEEFSAAGAYLQQLSAGLAGPYGIAVDNEGRIWVSDPTNNSIVEFKEASENVYNYFGAFTAVEGLPLNAPGGLGLDPATNDVWVAETGANRITELEKTPSGFVAHIRFGSAGAGQGQISQPYDVKVKASGNLVVVDRGNNRVEQFSPSGEFQAAFGTKGAGAGQFNEPSGIAVAGGGVFYVTDSGNKRVERWSQPAKPEVATLAPAGVTDKSATLKGSVNPSGVATTYRFEYGPTTAYGTSVPIPNGSVGSGVETIAENQTLVTEPETTIHYRIVATNAEGTRFGSDVRFTTPAEPFTFLSAFGTAGTGNGQFNRPMGTAVDASGNVYVVDRENNRVQKFNAKGEYLSQFGSAGSGNGQFKEPRSIAIGPNGHLWVADAGNARIEEFSAAGAYLQQLGSGKLTSPYGIAVDNEGRIWDLRPRQKQRRRVQRIEPIGLFVLRRSDDHRRRPAERTGRPRSRSRHQRRLGRRNRRQPDHRAGKDPERLRGPHSLRLGGSRAGPDLPALRRQGQSLRQPGRGRSRQQPRGAVQPERGIPSRVRDQRRGRRPVQRTERDRRCWRRRLLRHRLRQQTGRALESAGEAGSRHPGTRRGHG